VEVEEVGIAEVPIPQALRLKIMTNNNKKLKNFRFIGVPPDPAPRKRVYLESIGWSVFECNIMNFSY